MVYSVGLRTITKSLFQVLELYYCFLNWILRKCKYLGLLSNSLSPVEGITPSNSSRTRTPASLNATPANINIAGEFSTGAILHCQLQFSMCLYFLMHSFFARLDTSCQRPPTQYDLSDVQCHRRSHGPGAEPQHHSCTVGLQPVRLQWQHRRRRGQLLCLSRKSSF